MSGRGTVKLKKIHKMLKKCIPGHTIEDKEHHSWVRYNGLTYRGLPLGKHGKRDGNSVEVEMGHIKGLVRQLGISVECAQKHLPQFK